MRARALAASGLITIGLAFASTPAVAATGGANASQAPANAPAAGSAAGGAGFVPALLRPTVPGEVGVIRDGIAYAPAAAPIEVQRAIWAANRLQHKPYVYGGGHRSFRSPGYDCSGTVSYALHGGGLLDAPLDSSSFMAWGERGRGTWITVYTNPGHAWMVIAGLRLDTSGPGESGPRWRTEKRSPRGFRARHPLSL